MSLASRFSALINLQAEERRSFIQLFLLSLITGIGLSYYFVAVNTFLIQKASISNLPYAYIISGIGGVLLIRLYQIRQRQRGIAGAYRESLLAFFLVAGAVFWAFITYGNHPDYAIYLAYLGFLFNMPFTIIFALSFSAICARLYNLAQSKRLLALVGTGEIIASIIGYLTAPLISTLTGSPHDLLPIAAVCVLPAFIPISRIVNANSEKLREKPGAKVVMRKLDLAFFTNERFYLLIALVSVFSVAAIYFVDYAYLISVRTMSAYTGLEIAVIVGFFFSLVKIGELMFSFLSGHILSSKGVKFSILLLPLLLSLSFLCALLGGIAFSSEPIFILAFIFMAKLVERVIRKAITTPATKVLYQVTGPERLRIEATIEGVFNQVSTVMAGGVLLLLSALMKGYEPLYFLTAMAGICFVIFMAWAFLNLKLYENYKRKIWTYLKELKQGLSPKERDASVHTGIRTGDPLLDDGLQKAMALIQQGRGPGNLEPLRIYSPSIVNYESDEPATLHRKIASSYYTTDNYFHRTAIVRYFRHNGERFPLRILKEFGEISDLALRLEILKSYNASGARPEEQDIFYFEMITQKYSNELIYAMAARHDLRELEDPILQAELKRHEMMVSAVLFEILKTYHDPAAIQAIYEIISSEEHQDIESRLFALELLDNTVNDELKKRLVPIFEPAPFEQKIDRLQQFVPLSLRSKEDQLKELLIRDFTLVNAGLKAICMEHYFRLTGDERIIKAFLPSKIRVLRDKAEELLRDPEFESSESSFSKFRKQFELNPLETAYVANFGLMAGGKRNESRRTAVSLVNPFFQTYGDGPDGIQVDVFGLALLLDQRSGV